MEISGLKCSVLCCLLLVISQQQASAQQKSELKQIHVLVRHGDRTPTFFFPKDPNANFFKEGNGQLTILGKNQMFSVGQFLRLIYDGFLNRTYNPSEVYVRSSDKDRTLMSAMLAMAGLYPPVDERQRWKKDLDWQPIPVHTVQRQEDFLLAGHAVCPLYKEQYSKFMQTSPEVAEVNEKFQPLYDTLTNETGFEVKDIRGALKVLNTLTIESIHVPTPLPKWAQDTIKQLNTVRHKKYVWKYATTELKQLAAGQLIKEIVGNMEKMAVENKTTEKIFFYSAHSATVSAFLSALGVYNEMLVPYSTIVVVELYEKSDNKFAVQVLFKNDTIDNPKGDPAFLKIPACGTVLCPLNQFKSSVKEMIPEGNIEEICSSGQHKVMGSFGIILAVLVTLVSKFYTW